MKILKQLPPNYEAIERLFGLANIRNAVFTYGDTVYAPTARLEADGTVHLSGDLEAHEAVHITQQATYGVDAWWGIYLSDPAFRLAQELQAYRAQYEWAITNMARPSRRRLLMAISKSLSSKMYGIIIAREQACELIKGGME